MAIPSVNSPESFGLVPDTPEYVEFISETLAGPDNTSDTDFDDTPSATSLVYGSVEDLSYEESRRVRVLLNLGHAADLAIDVVRSDRLG